MTSEREILLNKRNSLNYQLSKCDSVEISRKEHGQIKSTAIHNTYIKYAIYGQIGVFQSVRPSKSSPTFLISQVCICSCMYALKPL